MIKGKQPSEPGSSYLRSLLCPLALPMLWQLANALSMTPSGNSRTFSAFITFMISLYTYTTFKISISSVRLSWESYLELECLSNLTWANSKPTNNHPQLFYESQWYLDGP